MDESYHCPDPVLPNIGFLKGPVPSAQLPVLLSWYFFCILFIIFLEKPLKKKKKKNLDRSQDIFFLTAAKKRQVTVTDWV